MPPLFVLVTLKGIHSPNTYRLRQDFLGKGSSSGGEGIGKGRQPGPGGDVGGRSLKGRALGWGGVNGEKSIRVVIWGRVKGFSGII